MQLEELEQREREHTTNLLLEGKDLEEIYGPSTSLKAIIKDQEDNCNVKKQT